MKKTFYLTVFCIVGLCFSKQSVNDSAIQKRIRAKLKPIRQCYQQQVLKDPSLAGKLSYKFVIGLKGRVTAVRLVENSLNNLIVETCVAHEIAKIQFPKPKKGIVEVVYPFTFNSK
ncbi:AgmX/PglI C-terminal domain-containing protein [bacterium]|nr:AgmX/PglI C-terminal domain-containing protein [bacterium]